MSEKSTLSVEFEPATMSVTAAAARSALKGTRKEADRLDKFNDPTFDLTYTFELLFIPKRCFSSGDHVGAFVRLSHALKQAEAIAEAEQQATATDAAAGEKQEQ